MNIILGDEHFMKSTDVLETLLNKKTSIEQYIEECKQDLICLSFTEQLNYFLDKKELTRSQVISKSQLSERYGYEIFKGTKKPSRDKVLQLCFGLELDIPESQHLLNSAGVSELYPRNQRDSIIYFCIKNHKTVMECNELLLEYHEILFE